MKILRRHIHHLGYPTAVRHLHRGDQESVARGVLREIRVPNTLLRPSDLLYHIGQWKQLSLTPSEAAGQARDRSSEHLAAMGYRRYQATLKAGGALDFDDLLLCTQELFRATRSGATRRPAWTISWWTNTRTPTPANIRLSRRWPRRTATCAWWGMTTSRSTAGAAPRCRTSCRFEKDWPEAKIVRLEAELPLDGRNPQTGQPVDRPQQDTSRKAASGCPPGRREAPHPATAR